jgi:putative ABC transport system substrate-binding protein
MKRRQFFGLVGCHVLTWTLAARAEDSGRLRRIGMLMPNINATAQAEVTAFLDALKGLGWVEGRNLQADVRWGAGDAEKFQSLSKELVNLRPDLIVGTGTPVVAALVQETRTIPIVFVNVADQSAAASFKAFPVPAAI